MKWQTGNLTKQGRRTHQINLWVKVFQINWLWKHWVHLREGIIGVCHCLYLRCHKCRLSRPELEPTSLAGEECGDNKGAAAARSAGDDSVSSCQTQPGTTCTRHGVSHYHKHLKKPNKLNLQLPPPPTGEDARLSEWQADMMHLTEDTQWQAAVMLHRADMAWLLGAWGLKNQSE